MCCGQKKMDAIKNIFMWSDYYLINMFTIYYYINKSLQNSAASNSKDIFLTQFLRVRSVWAMWVWLRVSQVKLLAAVTENQRIHFPAHFRGCWGAWFLTGCRQDTSVPWHVLFANFLPQFHELPECPYNMAAGFSQNKYPNGERKKNTLILEMTYHHFHSNLFYSISESLNPAYTQKEGMTHEEQDVGSIGSPLRSHHYITYMEYI